jgi:acetyl esterase/lipase
MGVEPSRIAVMGDSAGGGIAAGVALLARGRGLLFARQILIYPMLDDRNTVPDPALAPFVTWSHDENHTGWSALLGQRTGAEAVPPIAAPSRETDLGGVAPAYLEAGELDILRDKDIDYARRLARAGVPIELHVHPGVPHGFDLIAPEADVTKRAFADRIRVLRALCLRPKLARPLSRPCAEDGNAAIGGRQVYHVRPHRNDLLPSKWAAGDRTSVA